MPQRQDYGQPTAVVLNKFAATAAKQESVVFCYTTNGATTKASPNRALFACGACDPADNADVKAACVIKMYGKTKVGPV